MNILKAYKNIKRIKSIFREFENELFKSNEELKKYQELESKSKNNTFGPFYRKKIEFYTGKSIAIKNCIKIMEQILNK